MSISTPVFHEVGLVCTECPRGVLIAVGFLLGCGLAVMIYLIANRPKPKEEDTNG